MTFNVGDMVRLTGSEWGTNESPKIGEIYVVSAIEDGEVYIQDNDRGWHYTITEPGNSPYGAELVSAAPTPEPSTVHPLAQRIRAEVPSPSAGQAETQRIVSMVLHRLADLMETL